MAAQTAKINLERLEVHATNSCNLSCQGCSHYTNVLKGGTITPEKLKQDLTPWSKYLDITNFAILTVYIIKSMLVLLNIIFLNNI